MTNCWKCKIPCKPVTATCTRGFSVRAEKCPRCPSVYYTNEELEAYESKAGTDNIPVVESVWVETIAATE